MKGMLCLEGGRACLRKGVCNERCFVFRRERACLRKGVCNERLAVFRRGWACLKGFATKGLLCLEGDSPRSRKAPKRQRAKKAKFTGGVYANFLHVYYKYSKARFDLKAAEKTCCFSV